MKKLLILSAAFVALLVGCKKPDLAGNEPTGEGLVGFSLKSPASGSNLVLNAATPNVPVEITWNPSTPGLHTAPSYKWIAALKSAGNLNTPLISIPSSNGGLDPKLTLTYKQLDSLLKVAGIADGAKADLIWSVQADNGSTKLVAQNMFNLSVTRFKDGTTPFSILGPASSATNVEINPGSTTDNFTFNWTKSVPVPSTAGVKYKVNFYKDDASLTPLFPMPSNNNGADTLLTISYKNFSDSLTKYGFTDLGAPVALKWNVTATSGTWSQQSDYTNQLTVARLVRMYLVGSINGWDINAPYEMIADKASGRLGKVFYTYIKLNAGDEFKFVKTPGDWGTAYGNAGTSVTGFTTGFNQGGNFSVAVPGVYRLTIDLGNNMAYVQQKQVGLVGAMQGWDPSAPLYGGLIARNKFLILTNMSASDIFKFHDGPEWNNSAPDKARWWGKGSAPGLLDLDGNGDNLTAEPGAGIVRAIWDGTNPQQVKYELSKGQLRVVGAAPEFGSWNPDNALNMTYQGNGIWKVTVTIANASEFKFVSSQGWSYNYGGTGGSANSGSLVPGGNNLSKPAGTYTITVDEYNQTYTIQ